MKEFFRVEDGSDDMLADLMARLARHPAQRPRAIARAAAPDRRLEEKRTTPEVISEVRGFRATVTEDFKSILDRELSDLEEAKKIYYFTEKGPAEGGQIWQMSAPQGGFRVDESHVSVVLKADFDSEGRLLKAGPWITAPDGSILDITSSDGTYWAYEPGEQAEAA